MDLLVALLPLLALLACPLVMVFCMSHMLGRGNRASRSTQTAATAQPREERIAALESRLDEIRAELSTLQASASPTAGHAPRSNDLRSGADPEVGPVTPRPA